MSEFTLGLRCLRCGREYDAHGDLMSAIAGPTWAAISVPWTSSMTTRVCVQPYRREA